MKYKVRVELIETSSSCIDIEVEASSEEIARYKAISKYDKDDEFDPTDIYAVSNIETRIDYSYVDRWEVEPVEEEGNK